MIARRPRSHQLRDTYTYPGGPTRCFEKKYQYGGVVVAGLTCFALIVACARDVVAPQHMNTGDAQQFSAQLDSATLAAAPTDETSVRDLAPQKKRSSARKKVPRTSVRSIEDGTGVANEAFGLEVQDNYGIETVTFHMDATASHIDKVYIYNEGNSIYHAELTWTADPNGDYISGITQTMYYNNSPTTQTRYVCNGDRFCDFNEMRIPIGRQIHAAIASKVFGRGTRLRAASASLFQSEHCDQSAISAFGSFIQAAAQAAVAGAAQAVPPAPPANLSHALDCPEYQMRQPVHDAAEFWKTVGAMGVFVAVRSYQSATEIWDSLDRPASVGAPQLPYTDMFGRDATSCETVLGRLACQSITQKMGTNTQ